MGSWQRRVGGIVLIAAVLIGLELVPAFRTALSPLSSLGNNLAGMLYQQSQTIRHGIAAFVEPDREAELTQLQAQVGALAVDHTRLAQLEAENTALKSVDDFRQNEALTTVTTRVVGRDPSDPAGLIRLAVGSRDGVRTGAAVVDARGFFLAEVTTVGEKTSTARLLQSRTVNLSARVVGRNNMLGLLTSPDGLSLELTQLPKDGDLQIGDAVVTGSESDTVPPSLPIGTIVAISGTAQDLWRQATVSPLASPESADVVMVILTGNGNQ